METLRKVTSNNKNYFYEKKNDSYEARFDPVLRPTPKVCLTCEKKFIARDAVYFICDPCKAPKKHSLKFDYTKVV